MADEYKVYGPDGKLLHKSTVSREEASALYNEERAKTRGDGEKPALVRVSEGDKPGPGEAE